MLELAGTSSSRAIALPAPRLPISIRVGGMDDLPFIDELQKLHQKMLGFTPRGTLEEKIASGHVLVAEQRSEISDPPLATAVGGLMPDQRTLASAPVGYIISQDRYMGRDDVGIVFQLNVRPGVQRCLVGATLVKAVFERAAYGCRLFCCWCAQDIDANYFWESIGFVPLAFRSGNRRKRRTHIFWQRRIREGDTTTPYWFPAQTRCGMMNEARLVLPIPPGMRWSDPMPRLMPGEEVRGQISDDDREKKSQGALRTFGLRPLASSNRIALGGLRFVVPKQSVSETSGPQASKPKPDRAPKRKLKNDPKLVATARELRDRWLEQVNADPGAPKLVSRGKYEVSRAAVLPMIDLGAQRALPVPLPALAA